jgi:two-component system, cell cycle sensor histidine kinase and response regulator CckA
VCYAPVSGDGVVSRGGGIGPWLDGLAPLPQIDDPVERLSAHLVARTIDLLIGAGGLFFVVFSMAPAPMPGLYLLSLPIAVAFLIALRRLLNRGRVRTVALALCASGWLVVACDLPVNGPNTVAVGGFVLLIMVAGLTLGRRGAAVLCGLTIAALLPLMLGFVHGSFGTPAGPAKLVHYVTQVLLGGLLAAWWASRTRALLAELRRSETRRALILAETPDAIVSSDANGIMTFQNHAAEEMLGYPSSEVVGRPIRELQAAQGAVLPKVLERFRGATNGAALPVEELTLTHRDGHRVVVEAKGVALRDEGRIVGTLSILRDVTARKTVENERAALQRKLAGAQRMEAMGWIAGGVAHDFNNLLTVILCAAESVRGGPAAEALADISDAAKRGAVLTRQLLTFSRRQVTHPEPIDVNRAISDIEPVLRRLLGERVTSRLSLAPALPAVVIDPGQLDQVLLNLAANARDAMPGGGDLSIATRFDAGDSGSLVEIVVSDTGAGMDAETLASVFEPFFTTKGERGTGLGLAVVYGVVRSAGGTVSATSQPGAGTTFRLSLPASEHAPSHAAPPDGKGKAAAWRVALVDDDALVRRALGASLRAAGFTVEELSCPATLDDVPALEEKLAGIDALMTDIAMPGLTGVDLALELRRRGCDVPIVFVSGYAEHDLVERARAIPRSRWLQKPLTASDVSECLEQLRD